MSIIEDNSQGIELTREQKIAQAVLNNKMIGANALEIFITTFEKSTKNIYENPDFTPQEMFDGYFRADTSPDKGDCKKLFTASYHILAMLKVLKPDYVPNIPKVDVAMNANGSITVKQ
jgi:hypothetical protein